MSSTHKISALRSLATKVALGLGIALVASSIVPMAVAPASATGTDHALTSFGVLDGNFSNCLTPNFSEGVSGTYSCPLAAGSSVSVFASVGPLNSTNTANATFYKVHGGVRTQLVQWTGVSSSWSNITISGLTVGDSIYVSDLGGLTYTVTIVAPAPPTYHCTLIEYSQGAYFTSVHAPMISNVASGTTLELPVRTGYHVVGWTDTQAMTSYSNSATATCNPTSGNLTLSAVWLVGAPGASSSVSTADARPTPQLDLSGLSVIPAPAVGATAGAAGIDLKGKNLPTVASVTVAGKDGKVVTSTETALKLELPTLAPGSYDIVMKTEGNGSITIQNGLVIAAPAPKVDPTPIPPVVITPSIPRTTLVAASTPVPGFLPGKAGVSEAQKAIIQDVVLTKNVTSLECVGVTNAKVSAKLASARAASICAAAKAQNADLTTSVKTIAEAKVNGPIGSVLINYNH